MERADLLALVCGVYCDFVTFPFGILGQVWYLIVSIPEPCCFSYFVDCNFLKPHYIRHIIKKVCFSAVEALPYNCQIYYVTLK